MKQTTFVLPAFDRKKDQIRRERFRSAMEPVVARAAPLAVIEPHCAKAGRRGRPPMPLATCCGSNSGSSGTRRRIRRWKTRCTRFDAPLRLS